MGKQESGKPQSESKKPEGAPKGGAANGGSGGHSGPAGGAHGTGSPTPQSSGRVTAAKVGCQAQGCKGKDTRFSFCDEHFKQFKFGLIKKNGEPVSDFEKKFEHYQQWLKSQKVA